MQNKKHCASITGMWLVHCIFIGVGLQIHTIQTVIEKYSPIGNYQQLAPNDMHW